MAKSERDGGLRGIFKTRVPEIMWVPIETWAVSGAGVPDSWYISPCGAQGWVEYKREDRKLDPAQSGFVDRVTRYGGRAIVAVVTKDGDELRIFHGSDAQKLARLGPMGYKTVAPAGRWVGGPKRWNWGDIRRLLTADVPPPAVSISDVHLEPVKVSGPTGIDADSKKIKPPSLP